MLTYFECRRRVGFPGDLYRVRTWYLFGFIPVYQRWEQLTVRAIHATGSETTEG